jgi:DNA (cytosine-5)-methyltransferase 1
MQPKDFCISNNPPIKFLDVCSGIGTTRLSLQANGWNCVGRFEIDPIADNIYQSMFGTSEPNFGDITALPMTMPEFDVLVAGIPGSTYSKVYNMGKRPDTGVPFGIVGLLSRYRPKGFILECVAGFADPATNPTYPMFFSMLKGMGYEVEAHGFGSGSYGLPITTERFVIVGSLTPLPRFLPYAGLRSIRLSDCLVDSAGDELDTTSKSWTDYIAKSDATKMGARWSKADLHALADYTIIDRRQTDLRVFQGICPPFRRGNHGLFYVKNGRIKRITAFEGLLLHGVPRNIAERYTSLHVSEHRLMSYVGSASPVPMVESVAKWLEFAIMMASTKVA